MAPLSAPSSKSWSIQGLPSSTSLGHRARTVLWCVPRQKRQCLGCVEIRCSLHKSPPCHQPKKGSCFCFEPPAYPQKNTKQRLCPSRSIPRKEDRLEILEAQTICEKAAMVSSSDSNAFATFCVRASDETSDLQPSTAIHKSSGTPTCQSSAEPSISTSVSRLTVEDISSNKWWPNARNPKNGLHHSWGRCSICAWTLTTCMSMEMFLLSGPALDITADQSPCETSCVCGLETPWYFAWKVSRLTLTC